MRWKIFQWMKFLFRHSSNSRKLSQQKFDNELACVLYASKNADWNQQQLTDSGILANQNSANQPYCFLSNQKKVQFLAFFMWSVKEMYHALLPKAVYRDKGRGHDRRLEKQSQSKPAKLCLFIKQNIKSDWIAFYHKALQYNGKWWLLYLINSDLTNLSLFYEDTTNIISLIIYLFSIFFICRDTYPTQKQYYTYSHSGSAAAWRFNQLDYCVLPCKAIYWSFTVPREIP